MAFSTRILVISNYLVVRKVICALLQTEPEFVVCGDNTPSEITLDEIDSLKPDIILFNLTTSNLNGIKLISRITDHRPELKLLILIDYQYKPMLSVLKFGAKGLLLEAQPNKLIQAVKRIYHSQPPLDYIFTDKLFEELANDSSLAVPLYDLTGREIEVLRLVSDGKSNQEIAKELQITIATVRTHMNNILKKLHLNNRTQAVSFAWKEGLMWLKDCPKLSD